MRHLFGYCFLSIHRMIDISNIIRSQEVKMKRTISMIVLLLVLVMLNSNFISFAERKGDVPVIFRINAVTLSQDDVRLPKTLNNLQFLN